MCLPLYGTSVLVCFAAAAPQCTGKRLPEWAFQQFEVVTDRTIEGNHALWLVDDLVVPVPGQQNGNETWKDEDAHLREGMCCTTILP